MEYIDEDKIDYNDIIDTLINTFGEVLSRDVLYNIVENFGGDLEESANAVINIIMDGNSAAVTQPVLSKDTFEQPVEDCNQPVTYNTDSDIQKKTYSKVAENPQASSNTITKATVPHVYQATKATSGLDKSQKVWTEQIHQILSHHQKGSRVLIIMRGLPGSGKTFLAKKIIDAIYYTTNQHYQIHILSTDDYFMRKGEYIYESSRISEAHAWNQNRAAKAMTVGVSPVIIDNTNIELWEMEYYVMQGVENGYIIEIVEPNTSWALKVHDLFRINTHNVSAATIRRKLNNYHRGVNGDYLIKKLKLCYSSSKTPPVLRAIPPFSLNISENVSTSNKTSTLKEIQENQGKNRQCSSTETTTEEPSSQCAVDPVDNSENSPPLSNNCVQFIEIQNRHEEMEKLVNEWDNGDKWDDSQIQDSVKSDVVNSKPQRQSKFMDKASGTKEKFLPSDVVSHDWSMCHNLLPPWGENSNSTQVEEIPAVEKISSSTCVEYGDTNMATLKNSFKIINTVPRNINQFHIAVINKKIPEKWMLDKSTSTNTNSILTDTFNCPNKEQHFIVFRKLFKNIAKSDLRDIFDNCSGDVNWAVDIVLKGTARNELNIVDNDDCSDTDTDAQNDDIDHCQCLAAYDVIPVLDYSLLPPIIEKKKNDSSPLTSKPKAKKEIVSESSMELKRQIEQNVVISDEHYSDHCLKIRKFRRGESYTDEVEKNVDQQTNTETSETHATDKDAATTSQHLQYTPSSRSTPGTSKTENVDTENDDSDDENNDSPALNDEKRVSFHLGKEFIAQLDEIFERKMDYPSFIIPEIKIPMSILNELNSFWMESIVNQMSPDFTESEMIIQQDKEFAIELARKEEELAQAGKAREVPDLKEIMDIEFALSVYQKDVDGWRKNMPDDLAAKLTREKLYNLFPELSQEVLSELLMAHDNNFQETVEGLLISTGKTDVFETKNGVNKFITEKEMERQQKLIEAERKAIAEVEWPLLPKDDKVSMSDVLKYRAEAETHLKARNKHHNKALEYMRRGMIPAANYVSEVASYHKDMYEYANSKAAITLMQVHAKKFLNNSIIDLHYLRVCEAKESFDLFIDQHIRKLRDMRERNGVKFHTLFFITGRGLHSTGGPRLKPAIKIRISKRNLRYHEVNAGLLSARVYARNKLIHEMA